MPLNARTTWTAGQLVGASDLNAQIRDNVNYLFFERGKGTALRDNGASYTTTSATFVDLDATNLGRTVTIRSGFALVHFTGVVEPSVGSAAFDINIDGTRFASGGLDGVAMANSGSVGRQTVSFTVLVQGLSDGSHVFKVQWKSNGSTATLYSGNGSASIDSLPLLWVLEVG